MRHYNMEDVREAFFERAEQIHYENNHAIENEARNNDEEIMKAFPPVMDRTHKLKIRCAVRSHYYPYYEEYFDRYIAAAKSQKNSMLCEELLDELEEELDTFEYHGYRWILNIDIEKDCRYNSEKMLNEFNSLIIDANTTEDQEEKYKKVNYLFIAMAENYMLLVLHPLLRPIIHSKIVLFESKTIPYWLKRSMNNLKKTMLFCHLHPLFVEK